MEEIVKKGISNMEYYLQDHQGSNRVVVGTMDMSAHSWLTTEQVTHYYPFGGLWGDLSTNQGVQPYKFGGKELDRMYGRDLYDFGARSYDPAIARFTGVDPLAEKYYHLSPYAYCANNPVNYIDPDGREIWIDEGIQAIVPMKFFVTPKNKKK